MHHDGIGFPIVHARRGCARQSEDPISEEWWDSNPHLTSFDLSFLLVERMHAGSFVLPPSFTEVNVITYLYCQFELFLSCFS